MGWMSLTKLKGSAAKLAVAMQIKRRAFRSMMLTYAVGERFLAGECVEMPCDVRSQKSEVRSEK
jgi:hypothetical protein